VNVPAMFTGTKSLKPLFRVASFPPVLLAWTCLIIFWPLADVLRKWGGLNQPLYILQMLTPFILVLFLWNKRAIKLEFTIVLPCLAIAILTGVPAFYYSFAEYSFAFLGVWILNLSALLGPSLLICASIQKSVFSDKYIRSGINSIVSLVSILLLLNSTLAVVQSVLGRSHLLSAAAGGALDAQISTNTAIELRAPGLFTFIVGSANFSIICFMFLISSFLCTVSKRASLFRFLALASLPVAVIRSISRVFLFGLIVVGAPYASLLPRLRAALIGFAFLLFCLILIYILPDFRLLVEDGYTNFSVRVSESGGVGEGIVSRFFETLFSDAYGSDSALINNIGLWLSIDPLSALFGFGLGFSSPLFRFVKGEQYVDYGFISLDGQEFMLGETAFTSLLADMGIVGISAYIFLVIKVYVVFLKKFPVLPLTQTRAFALCSILALTLSYNYVYFRPSNFLFSSSIMLTPFACNSLINSKKVTPLRSLGSTPVL